MFVRCNVETVPVDNDILRMLENVGAAAAGIDDTC